MRILLVNITSAVFLNPCNFYNVQLDKNIIKAIIKIRFHSYSYC